MMKFVAESSSVEIGYEWATPTATPMPTIAATADTPENIAAAMASQYVRRASW